MAGLTDDRVRALRDSLRRLMVEHGALDEACRPCGTTLTLAHAHALLELRAARGPLMVSELAERLHIDRTNVSRLCAKLERLGQLERAPSREDGRALALGLTPKGRALAARVDRASLGHFRRLAGSLGGTLSDVTGALERLRDAIRETKLVLEETA